MTNSTVNEFWINIWKSRPDLQQRYPNVLRGDYLNPDTKANFIDWINNYGRNEYPEASKTFSPTALLPDKLLQPIKQQQKAMPIHYEGECYIRAPEPNTIKVLIASPVYSVNEPYFEQWLKNIKEIKGSWDILLVENSTTENFYRKVVDLTKGEDRITLYRIVFPNTSDERFHENTIKLAKVYEFIRHYFLSHNYTHLLIVESDVFVQNNIADKLLKHNLKIVSAIVRIGPGEDIVAGMFNVEPSILPSGQQYSITILKESEILTKDLTRYHVGSIGAILIKREVLEEIEFRAYPQYNHHTDVFFAVDCYRHGIGLYIDPTIQTLHLKNFKNLDEFYYADHIRGERLYPKYIKSGEHWVLEQHENRYALARSRCSGLEVLDIGCGCGYGVKKLAEVAKYVDGVELCYVPYTFALDYYSAENITYHNVDFFDFITNKKFDVITSFENIEHVSDGRKYIHRCFELLKEDGKLIISTPQYGRGKSRYHLKEYTYDEIVGLLSLYFDIELYYHQNPVHIVDSKNTNADVYIFVCRRKKSVVMPLISVWMGVKLDTPIDEKYFLQAVDSVMTQTYRNWELVIVYSGRIPEFPNDSRIHIYKQYRIAKKKEKDMNIGANEAIEKTTGEYCCRLDHDNVLEPTCLEDRLMFMLANPNIAMCYTLHSTIDRDGILISNRFEATDYDEDMLFERNYIDGNSVMLKGDLYRKYKFDVYEWAEDWGLWLKLINDGYEIKKLNKITYKYRFHEGQKTRLISSEIQQSIINMKKKERDRRVKKRQNP